MAINGTRVGWTLAALTALLAVVGCVTVDDKGDGGDDDDGSSESSGAGASGSGSGATSGGGDSYVCCLGSSNYACPDKAAFDKCVGFDFDGCMAACSFDDFECQDECFAQLETATHDPSSCVEDPSVDCGGSSGSGSGSSSGSTSSGSSSSGDPMCSGELSGCDYDSDCCSGNCADNTCWGTSFGNPCEYDSDCDSGNCYEGTCQ